MLVFQLGKYPIFTLVFFSLISEFSGLRCSECFWSDEESDYDEDSKDSDVELKYPKVEVFFDKKIKGTPTQEEIEATCKKKTCNPGQWCMKYSLSSSDPKKITRMCIGNPKQRSGCYQQVVETKDLKDAYLIREACLCNDRDLCNTASSRTPFSQFPLVFAIALIIFLFKFTEKH